MPPIKRHKSFLKDYSDVKLTDTQFEKFISYINYLKEGLTLPSESKDHQLKGNWKDFRECHLGGDTLLVYRDYDGIITLARIGSHSKIFG
jgi:mRNA interferase YafQ